MSPRGASGGTLGLLVLLAMAASLWLPSEGTGYQAFLKRNVDNPKSNYGNNNYYCNQMMRIRGLNGLRINIFIHASEALLKSICTSRGMVLRGDVTSRTLFPITVCKRRRHLRRLRGRYKGKSKIRRIRVTCERGLPVRCISYV